MQYALDARGRALALAALCAGVGAGVGAGCRANEAALREGAWLGSAQEEAPPRVEPIGAGSALLVRSAGLDELFADPRDAGLRRALALLGERVLELPSEVGGFVWWPPGLMELALQALGSPFTLRADVVREGDGPPGLRVQCTVEAGDAGRAAAMEARLETLLGLVARPSARSEDAAGLSVLEWPSGQLTHGARDDGTFVVAWGGFREEPALELGALGLPAGARPALAVELDLARLAEALAANARALDPSGRLARALAPVALLGVASGEAPLGLTLAVGHAAGGSGRAPGRAHAVAVRRGWVAAARALGLHAEGPIPSATLRLVPADATLASISRLEPLGLLSLFGTLEEPRRSRVQDEIEDALGLDLAADVLEPLGRTLGWYLSDTTGGGGAASAVVFAELDDAERAARTLEHLARALEHVSHEILAERVRVRAFEREGARGFAVEFPGLPVPLEPAVAIARGHLFAAASTQALQAALEHVGNRGRGLPESAALSSIELDGLQRLFFLDAPRAARDGYGLASALASALANGVRAPGDALRDPGVVLPPYPELVAGARPTLALARVEGDDLVTRAELDSSAALGATALLSAAPALVAASALAGSLAAAQPPPAPVLGAEERAAADIWALMDALHGYAIENDGRYPDSLDALVVPNADGFTFLDAVAVPDDPWGGRYLYELRDNEPRVLTLGADGRPGGEGADRDLDNLALEREAAVEGEPK